MYLSQINVVPPIEFSLERQLPWPIFGKYRYCYRTSTILLAFTTTPSPARESAFVYILWRGQDKGELDGGTGGVGRDGSRPVDEAGR